MKMLSPFFFTSIESAGDVPAESSSSSNYHFWYHLALQRNLEVCVIRSLIQVHSRLSLRHKFRPLADDTILRNTDRAVTCTLFTLPVKDQARRLVGRRGGSGKQ